MANNKIKVELSVDDKGSLKQTTAKADAAAKSTGKLGEAAATTDRRLKGASQQSSNTTKNFSKMAQGVEGGLVPAYAELAANVFAVTAVFQALKVAADFRVARESQIAFASATGVGISSLTKDIQKASDSMLGFQAASEAASIGIASGLNGGQLTDLAKGASNVSKILGRDVTDSFNRLVRGVTKAEPELLDELGITLRLTRAKENYAEALGKPVKALTLLEEKLAVNFEVQKQLDEKFNKVGDSVDIQGNAISKLATAFDKVLNPIKRFTAAITEPIAKFFADNVLSLAAAFGILAAPIIGKAIPALSEFADNAKKSARDAKKAFISTKKELKNLQKQAMESKVNPMAGIMRATQGIKPTSKGFASLQRGEEITKKQATQMYNYAKHNVGAVKQMSIEQRKIYIRELKIMANAKGAWVAKRQKDMQRLTASFKAQVSQMKAAWLGAMSTMKQGFSKMARGVDKAARAMGIIGVIVMLGQLAKDMLSSFVGLNSSQQKYAETINDLKERLKENNHEFRKFIELQEAAGEEAKGSLSSISAMGNMVSSTFRNIQGVFGTERVSEALEGSTKAAQKRLKNLLKEYEDVDLSLLGEAEYGFFSGKETEASKKRSELVSKISSDAILKAGGITVSKLKEMGRDISESGGSWVEGIFGTKADLKGATEEAIKAAKKISKGLDVTGLSATEAGKEFKALNDKIIGGESLSKEDIDRYGQLGLQLEGMGQAANALKASITATNSEFSKQINSITQYKGKYTDLIQQLEKQIILERDLKATGMEDRIKAAQDKIDTLNALDKIDRIFAVESEERKTADSRLKIGTTKSQQAQIDREQELELIRLQKEKIELTIQEIGGLDKLDATKKRMYLNELENLDIAKEKVERLNDITLVLGDTAKQAFEDTLGSAIDGLIKGTMSVKEAFASMVTGILQQLSRIIANRLAAQIISSMFPVGSTSVGVSDGSAGGDILSAAVSAANNPGGRYGGYTANMMPGYATGGIAKGPQSGYPVIMHGTEAIVPLPNGKEIPVQMKGGAGQVNNVTVNVSVASDGSATTETQADGSNSEQLGRLVASAVQKELHREKRSGGLLNPYGVA